ncbi:nicotinate phosphoribosyltransferase (NAPRTase) family domain-containing protein [Ditylenchus destructor]|uniref:Nicotinate phosphoribosyltransferase n=1 Tax=Ditylenchus destructor TaxID=166010 RepID=A0AAD4N599_9BILA|nr:nicotinate phosphoribosyltransferase (NAPRTase) family domain-containing protein [Ditylenchus destructor]
MAFVLPSEINMQFANGLHLNGQDSLVQPLLNDYYQFTMCYAYWRAGIHEDQATFDLFFRKSPFQGEYTVFAGLEDCLRFVENFRFSQSDMQFLKKMLPSATEPEFFTYLEALDCKHVKILAVPEGTVVFPKIPLLTVEGPLAICQLLETTFLNLINYASLVATNAARFRHAAGDKIQLMEFGLRRAQGPNGGLSASKYTYVGGFDATSNVLAGKLFGIPVKGTQAHSFICAFGSANDLKFRKIKNKVTGEVMDLFELAITKLDMLMAKIEWGVSRSEISEGELAAFCAYAIAFPDEFFALIDTYDVLRSGVINFCAVSLALHELGYRSMGCRIDSGDLSYLSKELRDKFRKIAELDPDNWSWVANLTIVASNDINEETIISLNEQQHEINSFGVGTHLVTCQKQPALGCVYKLVAISDQPKIKLSQEVAKLTIPGRKKCFRLYGKTGKCILDLMTLDTEPDPQPNVAILCLHPFEESKRAQVIATKVEPLQRCYWENGQIMQLPLPTLAEMKKRVNVNIGQLRSDHLRYLNPTPYKVSVSETLYQFLHKIWLQHAPIGQLE